MLNKEYTILKVRKYIQAIFHINVGPEENRPVSFSKMFLLIYMHIYYTTKRIFELLFGVQLEGEN